MYLVPRCVNIRFLVHELVKSDIVKYERKWSPPKFTFALVVADDIFGIDPDHSEPKFKNAIQEIIRVKFAI